MVEDLARAVVGEDRNPLSQCRRLIAWMYREFEWSASDYQHRTLDDIVARRAGNCAEQTRLLASLLSALRMETRTMAEINIQPPRAERGQSAAQMAARQGPTASVFGYRHNDHRWLEVRDAGSGLWFPADATLGVCGEQEWLAARMGFGPRPDAAQAMIVPLMVFVMDAARHVREDRTDHYVIALFHQYVAATVQADALLGEWARVVRVLAPAGQRAFEGQASFFPYGDQVQHALEVYRAIESRYRHAASPGQPTS